MPVPVNITCTAWQIWWITCSQLSSQNCFRIFLSIQILIQVRWRLDALHCYQLYLWHLILLNIFVRHYSLAGQYRWGFCCCFFFHIPFKRGFCKRSRRKHDHELMHDNFFVSLEASTDNILVMRLCHQHVFQGKKTQWNEIWNKQVGFKEGQQFQHHLYL